MKKSSIMMLALSGTMLVGCTQSEYIGDAPQQNGNEIVFSGASGKMTRATSNTGSDAEKLDKQIKFYGVKKTGTTDAATYADVFQNYILWSQGGATTSNPDGDWEYVGPATQLYGSDNKTIGKAQDIKYWDFATDEYNFVAGSPVEAFTYNKGANGEIATATVTGIAGHLNPNNGTTAINTDPIYIAAPVKVAKANYKEDVVFSFTRQQSFVRVGLFETIPGYEITAIKFYEMDEAGKWTTTPGDNNNITLASATANYFTGATDASATITYENWNTTPTFEFAYNKGTEFVQQNNWYGGKLENGVPAETSTDAVYGTDGDMVATTGYFTVIPTTSKLEAAPLLVKCDYELTSVDDKSQEKINVTGATAAIPAAYTKWAPNTSYTYLFKISDNTNGTTGVGGPEGLFPITFDAAVVEVENGTAQGTVTTVSTPSITTYQVGFADANKMKYVAKEPIYVTVQNDETGDLEVLTDKVKVFSLGKTAKTEADLILTAPTGTDLFTLNGAAGNKVGAVTYVDGKYGSFTPTEAGYYAIQYMTKAADSTTPASYAYKVVCVE
jgi:hypothetical protein